MTRTDIKAIFPDATADQMKQLLDINSEDVGKALNKGQTAQEQLEGQVTSLNEQIKTLTGQNKDLNTQIKTLTGDITQRDTQIKTLTEEKETALNELKAQHEVDVKTLTDKYDGDIKALNDQLKTAQEKASVADTLTERVAKLTQEVAERDNTISSNNKAYKIKDALRAAHAKNVDVVWPQLKLDSITEKDGALEGLNEQIEALQKTDPYLFDTNTGEQRGGVAGSPDVGNGSSANDAVNQAIRSLSGRY